MSQGKGISRRTVIKGALAGAATGIAGFPFISYGQSDVIRIGHLTPRTGFLGPLGSSRCRRPTSPWPRSTPPAASTGAGSNCSRKIPSTRRPPPPRPSA